MPHPAQVREKFFAALFPKLAKYIEAAWQMFHGLPYQMGYARKAFRAPHDPEVTASRRQFLAPLAGRGNWGNYDPEVVDIKWVASWAPYIGYGGADEVGYLLAAVIDAGGKEGEEVFEILKASAKNEHEIGAMGRHVSRALLLCGKPQAWGVHGEDAAGGTAPGRIAPGHPRIHRRVSSPGLSAGCSG